MHYCAPDLIFICRFWWESGVAAGLCGSAWTSQLSTDRVRPPVLQSVLLEFLLCQLCQIHQRQRQTKTHQIIRSCAVNPATSLADSSFSSAFTSSALGPFHHFTILKNTSTLTSDLQRVDLFILLKLYAFRIIVYL